MTPRAALWQERITEWKASGLTADQFCQDKEFTTSALRQWVYRFKREAQAAPKTPEPTVRVARVVRATTTRVGSTRKGVPASEPLVIEIGGARICVRPGFDRATLATVIALLTSCGDDRR